MGYESRIYVVDKSNYIEPDGKRWAEVVATFEMCKYPPLADYLRECKETDCYIFAEDGNTQIEVDEYDKPLTESELGPVIEILEKDQAEGEYYRRVAPLVTMLKAFQSENYNWRNLTILHYGH